MKPAVKSRKAGTSPEREIRAELARLGAPRAGIDPEALRPMKPETADRPFSRPGWVFELKYDGEDVGKTAYVRALWFNPRGESGPQSDDVTATIAA